MMPFWILVRLRRIGFWIGPPVADGKARETAIKIANTAQRSVAERPLGTSRGDEPRPLAHPSIESHDPQVWGNVCDFAYGGADDAERRGRHSHGDRGNEDGAGRDRVRQPAGNEAIARENEATPAGGWLPTQSVTGKGF